MSKGPGRIERAILATFIAEPDNAFTTADLCSRIYRVNQASKRHRVAVLRALTNVAARTHAMGIGGRADHFEFVMFNRYSQASYERAELMWMDAERRELVMAREQLETDYAGGLHAKAFEPGKGHEWWRVQYWIAERDGDTAKLAEADAALERFHQANRAKLAMYGFKFDAGKVAAG